MDKRFLEECLERGMSLERISSLTGRPSGTVGYWVHKHGLRAPNSEKYAPRGGLTREQLASLVERRMTVPEMAAALDRSVSTVRYWLEKHALPTNGRRRTRRDALSEAPKFLTLVCGRHGQAEFVLEGRGYYRCKRCRSEAVARRRRVVKQTLIEEAGGACAICGYDRCPAALQFHHLDPEKKEFHLAERGLSRSLARSRREARKCMLLCANCHAEIEVGFVAAEAASTTPGWATEPQKGLPGFSTPN